jgi:tetraacyldisaccharide 4'-kinase
MLRQGAEWVWYDDSAVAAAIRLGLSPLSAAFGAIVRQRNLRYDRMAVHGVLPALSVGNLTVGGTGKTPLASWFARRLHEAGATPAIVLRGYGDDEWRVHRLLTPALPVVRNADRVAAMAEAQTHGADCAVLDDAFQHRRAARVSNVVLVSADRFPPAVHLLPAGPFREGLAALARATAVVVTVKAAAPAAVERVEAALRAAAPAVPLARVQLVPGSIRRALGGVGDPTDVSENTPESYETGWLGGRRLLLTSAIADADAFERQVVAHGVRLVRHLRFPDHHDFSEADVARLIAESRNTDGVLCTLKDAVKLAARWPREAAPLWYVSQTLVIDRGAEVLEQECHRVLAARADTIPTAG